MEAALAVTFSGNTPRSRPKAGSRRHDRRTRVHWRSELAHRRRRRAPNAAGTINLTACTAIPTITGTIFNGEAPTWRLAAAAPTSPTLPAYVVLPACICGGSCRPAVECPEDPLPLISRTVNAVQQDGVPNQATLSEAVQQATTGETIGVFLRRTST